MMECHSQVEVPRGLARSSGGANWWNRMGMYLTMGTVERLWLESAEVCHCLETIMWMTMRSNSGTCMTRDGWWVAKQDLRRLKGNARWQVMSRWKRQNLRRGVLVPGRGVYLKGCTLLRKTGRDVLRMVEDVAKRRLKGTPFNPKWGWRMLLEDMERLEDHEEERLLELWENQNTTDILPADSAGLYKVEYWGCLEEPGLDDWYKLKIGPQMVWELKVWRCGMYGFKARRSQRGLARMLSCGRLFCTKTCTQECWNAICYYMTKSSLSSGVRTLCFSQTTNFGQHFAKRIVGGTDAVDEAAERIHSAARMLGMTDEAAGKIHSAAMVELLALHMYFQEQKHNLANLPSVTIRDVGDRSPGAVVSVVQLSTTPRGEQGRRPPHGGASRFARETRVGRIVADLTPVNKMQRSLPGLSTGGGPTSWNSPIDEVGQAMQPEAGQRYHTPMYDDVTSGSQDSRGLVVAVRNACGSHAEMGCQFGGRKIQLGAARAALQRKARLGVGDCDEELGDTALWADGSVLRADDGGSLPTTCEDVTSSVVTGGSTEVCAGKGPACRDEEHQNTEDRGGSWSTTVCESRKDPQCVPWDTSDEESNRQLNVVHPPCEDPRGEEVVLQPLEEALSSISKLEIPREAAPRSLRRTRSVHCEVKDADVDTVVGAMRELVPFLLDTRDISGLVSLLDPELKRLCMTRAEDITNMDWDAEEWRRRRESVGDREIIHDDALDWPASMSDERTWEPVVWKRSLTKGLEMTKSVGADRKEWTLYEMWGWLMTHREHDVETLCALAAVRSLQQVVASRNTRFRTLGIEWHYDQEMRCVRSVPECPTSYPGETEAWVRGELCFQHGEDISEVGRKVRRRKRRGARGQGKRWKKREGGKS